MRKGWIVLLTAVLVVAFAAPAMADLKVSGWYRAKSMMSNFFDGGGGPSLRTTDEEQTNAYVEQRARIKFQMGTADVKAVFQFESDMNWGAASSTVARNEGGALSADSVQLETKSLYVWFKIPDTSIAASVGMQPMEDAYYGVFSNSADMAGVFITGAFEPVKYTLGWAKLYELSGGGGSGGYDGADDTTLYMGEVNFAPSKDMNLGVNLYYLQDDSGRSGTLSKLRPQDGLGPAGAANDYTVDIYMPGVNFSMNAGPVKLSGFAFYQFGTFNSTVAGVDDIDVKAFAIDLRGDLKAGPGTAYLEGLWVSGGDGTGNDYKSPITLGDYQNAGAGTGTGGNAGFGRTHMYFLFAYDSLNVSQCIVGCSGGEYGDSLGNSGRGLWHVAAGYSLKLTEKLKGEANVGYLSAVKLWEDDTAIGRKKDMATEINARLDYTLQKGLTLSGAAAYMKLGDFVRDDAVTVFEDSYWMTYARVAYSF